MVRFSVCMADPAAGIHTETAVSISLPERAEGARCRSVPHDKTEKESVYPGADRSWKDDLHCFSGGESGGRKSWRPYFLSDGKDDHRNGGTGSV